MRAGEEGKVGGRLAIVDSGTNTGATSAMQCFRDERSLFIISRLVPSLGYLATDDH